jgi:tyrosinase
MDRFISSPLELTASQIAGTFRRADVVFYEVDARGASFTARVFLDRPGPKPNTSPGRKRGYAGFFTIFGHGGCFGDDGHCDVPDARDRDPFDLDPPHPLTPQTKLVEVTARLMEIGGKSVIVTVLPVTRSKGGAQLIDALQFKGLRLLSYD